MQALRTATALGLGLSLIVVWLALLATAPVARALISVADEAASHPAQLAQVAIAFDRYGRPLAHAVRQSSGSPRSDEAAVSEALELASLRQPSDLAGRTLLFTARFDQSPQLD
jgi:hypothetical protein